MEGLVKEDQHSPPCLVTQGKKHRLQEWGQRMKDGVRLLDSSQAPRTRSQGPTQNKAAPAGPHSSTETETGTQGSQPKLEDPVGQLWAPRRGPLTSVQSRATHRDSVVTATVLLEPAGSRDRALTAEGFAGDTG